ncbi:SUMF1/EgtB/PvdO family nonheme iron enzyme [candidate division KSB1 bacterium]|nr:SUMF1/EgtB/PvdO family nonheme iron enzyme [candidate division KSB1 bacterium]
MQYRFQTPVIIFLVAALSTAHAEEGYINSVGMKMIYIKAGSFNMGDSAGQWDEQPVHRVTISNSFFISAAEMTIEQYRLFRPGYQGFEACAPYASGVSWHDAVAFCQWLSEKEGRPYRLPTEAEWEYACRAGAATSFSSGDEPPGPETDNIWGIRNMHTGVLEWCLDWYGPYEYADQTDPVGRAHGFARVVRGGLPDDKTFTFDRPVVFYARSANRAGLAPEFAGFISARTQDEEMPDESYDQFQPGLVGVLFDNVQATKPLSQSRIRYLHSEKLTWPSLNDWSAHWQGSITAPVSGEVHFHAEVDDGLTLTIDGQKVIDVTAAEAKTEDVIAMNAGKRYPLLLRYFQDGGESFMRLYWSWPGQARTEIPGEALSSNTRDAFLMKRRFDSALAAGKKAPSIGFRVVAAPMPSGEPLPEEKPFFQQGVKQRLVTASRLHPHEPYFRKRYLLPIPPENVDKPAILAAGFSDYFGRHNHDPALTVCPNGDLIVVFYTSIYEDEPEVAMAATRLRYGADEWDWPSPFIDFADVNDVAPNLWTEKGRIYFFFGNLHLDGTYPFQWTVSDDNGAGWSEVRYPMFAGPVGPHTPQPINSVFRDASGTIYMACDGLGATSLLFASDDDGATWYDTGGRTGGRHSTFVQLKNSDILAMGGKHADIGGFMPQSVSRDKGKTYQIGKTPFPCLGTNQRPTIIRLASGRLFFAGDLQRTDGFQPKGFKDRGSFVALSDDEGKTWHTKKLSGGQEHESALRRQEMRGATLGYAVAQQDGDGLIHLIVTMTHPCLHYTLNEAWILAEGGEARSAQDLMRNSATAIQKIEHFVETYSDASVRLQYSGGLADDGRFLLHGEEVWYNQDGVKRYSVQYHLGSKIGAETLWDDAGKKVWQWQRGQDGEAVWMQWWENGLIKSASRWRDGRCDGVARRWDRSGKLIGEVMFKEGELVQ